MNIFTDSVSRISLYEVMQICIAVYTTEACNKHSRLRCLWTNLTLWSLAVCPLEFKQPSAVIAACGDLAGPNPSCCSSLNSYIATVQKQMLITNRQAINCAALFGSMLQKGGVMTNIYELCDVDLKDFSLQGTSLFPFHFIFLFNFNPFTSIYISSDLSFSFLFCCICTLLMDQLMDKKVSLLILLFSYPFL